MSWRESLQPGSFRGIPFCVDGESEEFGADYQVHKYPLRSRPYTEYLGDVPQQWRLNLFVIGDDYMAQRDALRQALAKPGPGTLIHPKLGRLEVVAISPRCSESTREGGMARFEVTFCIYGGLPSPDETVDTLAATREAASTLEGSAQATFAKTTQATGVEDLDAETGSLIGKLGDTVSHLNGRLRLAMAPAATLAAEINRLTNESRTLLAQPVTLAATLGSVVSATIGAATTLSSAFALYDDLADQIPITALQGDMTPSRRQQTSNHNALAMLLGTQALTGVVRYTCEAAKAVEVVTNARSPFDSYDHAQAVRDTLGAALATRMQAADDMTRGHLADLRVALYRHLAAHSARLARVSRYQAGQAVPALVIAHRLYGDIEREADLVRRNRLRHPLFVTPHQALEVLSG